MELALISGDEEPGVIDGNCVLVTDNDLYLLQVLEACEHLPHGGWRPPALKNVTPGSSPETSEGV